MSVHDDLSAAGRALDALQAAVSALGAHYGASVDLRRLREDVSRVCADLDLLRETAPPGSAEPVPAGQGGYDPAFLVDDDGEGGPPGG